MLPSRGPLSHSTASVIDENGLQFFNLIDQNAVGCWNSILPYAPINQAIVARHDEALIFPADVKVRLIFIQFFVIKDNFIRCETLQCLPHRSQVRRDLLWIISDRMPIFLLSTLNYTDVNFRILTTPVQAAVAGTVCDNMPWRFINNHIW